MDVRRAPGGRRSGVGPASVLLVLLLAIAAAACSGAAGSEQSKGSKGSNGSGGSSTTRASSTTTLAPTTTTTVAPTTTTTTAPPPLVLRQGAKGPLVALVQHRLAEMGFRPGAVDGEYSNATFAAVMAFQKYEGLGADGHAGPITLAALGKPLSGAGPRNGSSKHIEVDVSRQILFAVGGNGSLQIINVSTGSGRKYDSPGGGTAVADTPRGDFKIQRRIDGIRIAPLGKMYRPMYFQGGFAIHGSSNVPGYPASHGCIRTTNPDQDFLFGTYSRGTPVDIYPA
jgi:lipoprotein-anchoring transpeptidase ErfK/SrfK